MVLQPEGSAGGMDDHHEGDDRWFYAVPRTGKKLYSTDADSGPPS